MYLLMVINKLSVMSNFLLDNIVTKTYILTPKQYKGKRI